MARHQVKENPMIKHLVPVMLIAVLFAACGNQKDNATEGEAMKVSALMQHPENYADKEVTLTGTVTHICKHGGKRLHLSDLDADQKIRVESGDKIEAFNRDLEGSDIVVTGVLRETRIDEQYLSEWEDELMAAEDEESEEGHEGERHAGDSEQMKKHEQDMSKEQAGQGDMAENEMAEGEESVIEQGDSEGHVEPQGMDAIREIREELKTSGKSYLSRWHIEAVSYRTLDQATGNTTK
jgi:hypothetical protein